MLIQTMAARGRTLLASRWALSVIVGVLVLQAAWIALLGRYPMAFDEDFHLGVIKLYAAHGLPFWSGQPAGGNAYGAVTRDPSYLFHYLMSFPYTLLKALTSDLKWQVLGLRTINIGLFAGGLVLWQRLLLKTGVGRATVHGCLLLFILVPAVPLLAAQINYDNLLLPVTASLLLISLQFLEKIKHSHALDLKWLATIGCVLLLGSIIKYAFLPIAIGVTLYLLWYVCRAYTWRSFWQAASASWRSLSLIWRVGLVVALLASGGLFGERYGVNIVKYHTPVPDCGQVLSVQACSQYGPWIRDYNFELNKVAPAQGGPLGYADDWLYGMWLRLFFTVDGPTTLFQTRGPLLVPAVSAIVLAIVSLPIIVLQWRRITSHYNRLALQLFGWVVVWYVGVLYLDGYRRYVQTGQPVAINGRYLLPILLLIMVVVAMAWTQVLRRRAPYKVALFVVVCLCFSWGGGALTYVLRSNDAWYWPSAPVVKPLAHGAQHILGPITPGYSTPTQFLR